ncbi:uncharacterized protein LOC128963300 [Oppia nitens]|uniref:uncharacterized protein LOC128963300 n=1 Tax=Oppia nitens TaxID=1686743 RepID=UPI0023DC90AA|nr:uncharacterized protein LOC128963300 [Oppia nitens]
MRKKRHEVIGGFNAFLREQKRLKTDSSKLYLIKFNTNVNIVYSGDNVKDVPDLKPSMYTPCGRTALFDAISEGIYIADEDMDDSENEKVICVIITDGEENCSKDTTKDQVRRLLAQYESKGNWAFVYIGKNPDRWTKEVGMSAAMGISYNYNEPRITFKHISNTVTKYRVSKYKLKKTLFQRFGLK